MLSVQMRPIRFSLRALILVSTALVIWFSVITIQARKQAIAVKRILETGGEVSYKHDPHTAFPPKPIPGPRWLRRLIGDDYFVTATAVVWPTATDDAFSVIEGLPQLEILHLCPTAVSTGSLKHLRKLSRLKHLMYCNHDNAQRDDGAGLAYLGDLSSLQYLDLAHLPNLSGHLGFLHKLRDLQTLQIWNARLTEEDLVEIGRVTQLSHLDLADTLFDAGGLRHLVNLSKLETLNIRSTSIPAGSVSHIGELGSLRHLQICCNEISQDVVDGLRKLRELKYLAVYGPHHSDHSERMLTEALPHCSVAVSETCSSQ